MLDLPVGRDLALQLDEVFGSLIVHAAELGEAYGADHDQQSHDRRGMPRAVWRKSKTALAQTAAGAQRNSGLLTRA